MHPRAAAAAPLAVALLTAAFAVGGCAPGAPAAAARPAATDPPTAATSLPASTPSPTPELPLALRVAVRAYHEPLDHAHRNYCGAGATEVLLSAWLSAAQMPDVETVARAILLDPDSGATGSHTAAGINAFLHDTVVPALGGDRYRGEHVTTLDAVLQRLHADLGDPESQRLFGHTVPVMVQTMTKTMPGWRGWQATHMITIAAASLDTGNPDVDTVTYAETPSPIAGYNGPDFQTITVRALWTAMQAFLRDDPADPVNVIS